MSLPFSIVYPARVVGIDFSSASNGPLGIVLHGTGVHYNSGTINGGIVDDSALSACGINSSSCQCSYIIEETCRVDFK